MKQTVRIYACGGGGIAQAQNIPVLENAVGLATPSVVYCDTSEANLMAHDTTQTFLIKGAKGSGGLRSQNAEPIVEAVGDLLREHPPTDFNIVLFTGGGGSGSVFGPIVIGELLQRGVAVIGLMIGSTESGKVVQNVTNTFRSLESVRGDYPLVLMYFQNQDNASQSVVDQQVAAALPMLLMLASGENYSMDPNDLLHLLRYDRVTDVPPQLTLLDIFAGNDPQVIQKTVTHPITSASIYGARDADVVHLGAQYDAFGFRPEIEVMDAPPAVHFVTHTQELREILTAMQSADQKFQETAKSIRPAMDLLSGVSQKGPGKLVL